MYQKETGEIIMGIDHGYSTIKSVDMITKNGVKKCKSKPAMEENTLLWQGEYYKVGEGSMDFTESNVSDERLYVNTLAAIGKVAKKHKFIKMNVILGTGLPFARHGEEKESFRNYFLQRSDAEFEYEGWRVSVHIKAVYVFKQGYAAAYGNLRGDDTDCYLVDIGNVYCMGMVPESSTYNPETYNNSRNHRLSANKLMVLTQEMERTGIDLEQIQERYAFDAVDTMSEAVYRKIISALSKTPDAHVA